MSLNLACLSVGRSVGRFRVYGWSDVVWPMLLKAQAPSLDDGSEAVVSAAKVWTCLRDQSLRFL